MKFVVELPEDCALKPGFVLHTHGYPEPENFGFLYVYPDRTVPDQYERTLPEVFPDFAPGSFTFDADLGGWVWTTFNSFQWDLNYSNPAVFRAMLEEMFFIANTGVDVLRLDAAPFLWKRRGTDCQNQPEVHWITQALRALAHIACPAVVFKAEAIVGPQDLVHYLGQGRHHGKVSDPWFRYLSRYHKAHHHRDPEAEALGDGLGDARGIDLGHGGFESQLLPGHDLTRLAGGRRGLPVDPGRQPGGCGCHGCPGPGRAAAGPGAHAGGVRSGGLKDRKSVV